MVSGVPTASGYEERIRFSELEVVDAGAIDHGVLASIPEGNYANGWDVNVAGVRTIAVKRNIRSHNHAVSHQAYYVSTRTNFFRNSSYELRNKAKRSILWADDMATSLGCTRDYIPNYLERFCRLCQGRTSKVRRHRDFLAV